MESTRNAFDRRPDESTAAFEAFSLYRDAGPGRTLEKVAKELGKSATLMARWSSKHEWVARCIPFDEERDQLEQAAKAKVAAEHAAKWEARRLRAAATNWHSAKLLRRKAAQMLAFPLSEDVINEADANGNPIVVKRSPAKWNMATAGALMKVAAELRAAAIAEALGSQDDGFDPSTATPEECRAYLEGQGLKIATGTAGASK